jgi:uncharacterized lipoprotein YmbA
MLLALIAVVVVTASSCSTTPARFYTLDSTATSDGAPAVPLAVMVGPVSVPASVDQPDFVVQVASNRVQLDEFNRWAAPLGDSIARAVAGDLATLLGTPDVATSPMANFIPAYSVSINVQRFESTRNQGVLLDAVWAVHPSVGGATRSGRTVAQEAAQGDSYDALAAAHSRALARMSGEIAAAIRVEARRHGEVGGLQPNGDR